MVGEKEKSETMNLILTDPQLLECYICREPLSTPLFQCKNGHISCSSCCTRAHNKCSSCGSEIGHMRCRSMETLLESIKIECQNSTYGCKKTIYWNKRNDHESSCVYKPCSCPLTDCSFVGSSGQLSSHFTKKHKNSAKSFSYDSKFTMCFNNGETYRILLVFFKKRKMEPCTSFLIHPNLLGKRQL
ncbi:E3 ubiquitin-protein ligase SINA-like 10 [Momordica charantia]|uniref:RING-type E3 ubiquitin transferase n=1 Tax=Momordica charantia TaxID=3673 RepID=A0A6J1CQA4_MOMCH|nr:E3 ubiquitin-protein ligase SINA-like 10 [Momordica charantia]